MPNAKKKMKLLAALGSSVIIFGSVLTGCASPTDTPIDVNNVACEKVNDQLAAANDNLTNANADVEEFKGTPGEDQAVADQAQAQATVTNLQAKQTTCATPSADPTETSSADPTTAPPADPCPGSYVVHLDPNAGANLFSQGLSPDNEQMRQQVLDAARTDPRVLQVYYNASPLGQEHAIQNTTDIAPVQEGSCYTDAGKQAYADWSVLWKVTKLTADSLPDQGTNTGAEPGGSAFQDTGTIPAGTGVKVVYQDANGNEIGSHWVRLECGNVVLMSPITLPVRPESVPPIVSPPPAPQTSEQPPPETPPTSPSTPEGCPPVSLPDSRYVYDDSSHCSYHKLDLSYEDTQDHGPQHQGGQDNSFSGVDIGSTKDGDGNVIPEPSAAPTGPAPQAGTPAPANNGTGNNSGGGTGSSPGGSHSSSDGTSGGAAPTPAGPAEDSGQGGSTSDNNSDGGGF